MLKGNNKDLYKNHTKQNLLDLFELFENINQIFDDFQLDVENIHIQYVHNVCTNEDMCDILRGISISLLLFVMISNEVWTMMDLGKRYRKYELCTKRCVVTYTLSERQ
jgi:hypothetical protein